MLQKVIMVARGPIPSISRWFLESLPPYDRFPFIPTLCFTKETTFLLVVLSFTYRSDIKDTENFW